MDSEDQIPSSLPCLPAGRVYKREAFPSLVSFSWYWIGKEGSGEIFTIMGLYNYGLLNNLIDTLWRRIWAP